MATLVAFISTLFRWIFKDFRNAILIALSSSVIFFVLLFPFGDLSDFVTSKVSEATQNRVYVQMESLGLGFIPSPSISGTNVTVEAADMPPLKAEWIQFSPSLLDIIANVGTVIGAARGNPADAQKIGNVIGASISAEGLLGADVDIDIKPAGKNQQGAQRSKIYVEMDQLDLSELPKALDLPIQMSGRADFVSNLRVYPNFEDQPEGEMELKAKSIKIPPNTIYSMAIPGFTFGEVTLKGKMSNGNFIIEEANLGKSSDPLHGRLKGQMALRFNKIGPSVYPALGAYDFKVDLELNSSAEKDFSIVTPLISNYRSSSARGSRYLVQIRAAQMGMFPDITQISTF